ncbi:MAG: LysM peptidoglycan-binding domain-containing protein [Anaerolineae bacterium]|nr:LysM peptidoglycan-binding domain-containing protein [Anaerolineae bacterium]
MRSTRILTLAALLVALLGLSVAGTLEQPALAQGANLLQNAGFEGAVYTFDPDDYGWVALYASQRNDCKMDDGTYLPCNTAQVPVSWIPWWISQSDSDPDWKNRMPEYKPADPPFMNRIHSGQRAAQYFTFHGTHIAGLLQVVTVPANAQVRFSIWGQAWSSASDAEYSDFPTTVNMRIGIDPTGSTNPYSPAIVWSDYKQPYDAYQQFVVEAQAQGTSVTVFTISSPDEARKHNDIYWDDAELVVLGAAAPPPATAPASDTTDTSGGATTVAVAPPAQIGPTATPDAEGIIYAEVGEGDSFWSIAARHGITLDEIYELNNAGEGDFVQVGDMLIVGQSTPSNDEAETASEAGDEEEAEEATPRPTATRPLPTPTAPPQKGEICLTAFVDENRNGLHDPDEPLKAAVAFTIASGDEVHSNYVTTGTAEPYCITGLDPGSYQITRSTAPGEVLTTNGDWSVSLAAGTEQHFEFGSYEDEAVTVADSNTTASTGIAAAQSLDDTAEEGDMTRVLVIAAVVVAVLLLVGVLVVILSARRAI